MDELNQVQNPNVEPEKEKSPAPTRQSWIWLGIFAAVAVTIVFVIWRYLSFPVVESPILLSPTPTATPELTPESEADIEEDVLQVDVGDLDKEFKNIDSDLDSL